MYAAGCDPEFVARHLHAQHQSTALKMNRLIKAVMIEAHEKIDGAALG